MRQVFRSGRPYVAKACGIPLPAADGQKPTPRYFDIALEPVREGDAGATGLLLFAAGVTAQEEARQKAHHLSIDTRRLDTRLRQLTDERGPRWFGACTGVDDQHRLREVLQTQYDELAKAPRLRCTGLRLDFTPLSS